MKKGKMTEEPSLPGFVARVQAKPDAELSYMEREYIKAMKRLEERK